MIKKKWFIILMILSLPLIMGACSVVSEIGNPAAADSIHVSASQNKNILARDNRTQALLPHPQMVQGLLDNGLRYVLLKNKKPENRISMHLDVQVGSMHETDKESGVAHYLEHMLFNGSTHYEPGDLVEYFQSIGMMFGPDANAHTGFYETVYDIFLPAVDEESISKALTVLKDYAQGALLLQEEVDRERGVILAEKRERDSVSYRTFKASLEFEMPGSRLSKRLPIGTDAVLNQVDHSLLKSFYDAWYRPENMVLVMVGDFDPAQLEKLIAVHFNDMAPRGPKRLLLSDSWTPPEGVNAFYHYEAEAGNTEVSIQTIKKVPFEVETLAAYKKRTVEDLAVMMLQNRLSRAVGKKETPFSDAGAYAGTYFRDVHFSVVASESDPEQWQASLAFLEMELRRALEYGFTPTELQRVKADMIQSLESAVNEAESRESTRIARKIVREINRKRIFQAPADALKILKPFIEALTLEAVDQAFAAAWNVDHRQIKVTGNAVVAPGTGTPADFIEKIYHQSAQTSVIPWSGDPTPVFPYLPIPETEGNIISKKQLEPSGIVQIDLQNRVRLNLLKTDYKTGEFLFKIDFGAGKRSQPPRLDGLGMISESVVNESGLGQMDQETLEAALAGRDLTMEFGMDQSSFHFSGRVRNREAELLFQLLQASLVDPGFRASSFNLAVDRYRQMYRELKRSPQGMMSLEGDRFLAGGDARFGMPALEAVNQLTLEDVKNWLLPFFSHAPLELSIVGDISLEEMERLASVYLGTLPIRQEVTASTAGTDTLPDFPRGENRSIDVNSKIDKALVHLAFQTDDFWDIRKTRRLSLLARVFSERLRKTIREKLGVTYSPHAYNNPSRTYDGYGVLHAVVATAPTMADEVAQEMGHIADALVTDGVTAKELSLVLPPVLTQIRDLKKNNRYWLKSVLSGSRLHPEQIQWAEEIYPDYGAATARELSLLAARYLGRDNRAQVIIRAQ